MEYEEKLAAFAEKHGLNLELNAIPRRTTFADAWSDESRIDRAPVHFSGRITTRDGAEVWRGEYSVGAAHPVTWIKAAARPRGTWITPATMAYIKSGKWMRPLSGGISLRDESILAQVREAYARAAPVPIGQILECLVMDWRGVSPDYCSGFVDWAENYGYDTDSRKAEEMFRHCVTESHKAQSALGRAFGELMQIEEYEE